jgi:hypothetical protein
MCYGKIDYYSFIINSAAPFGDVGKETCDYVINAFRSLFPSPATQALFDADWHLEAAKGFYSARLRHELSGVALSFGSVNAHIFCELSGKPCDTLDSAAELIPLVRSTHAKCSRIDFAVDFSTDTTPERFSAFRNTTRWKYAPVYPSSSGTTVYVGSRTSERMARVYRYNKPHPRAHLLRVEAEYKGKAARAIAALVTEKSFSDVIRDAHSVFGWSHDLWNESIGQGEKVSYTSHRPANANTVRWLYGDVAKALWRAIDSDLIDFEEWLKFVRERPKDEN